MRNPTSRSHRNGTRGQGLVEFALIMPVLMLIVMGIFDFGRVMIAYASTSNALRDAARFATLYGDSEPRPYLQCDEIERRARQALFANAITVMIEYIKEDNPTVIYENCEKDDGTPLTDNDFESGDLLRIRVTASVQFVTPLISSSIPKVDLEFHAQRTIAKTFVLGQNR